MKERPILCQQPGLMMGSPPEDVNTTQRAPQCMQPPATISTPSPAKMFQPLHYRYRTANPLVLSSTINNSVPTGTEQETLVMGSLIGASTEAPHGNDFGSSLKRPR